MEFKAIFRSFEITKDGGSLSDKGMMGLPI